MDSVTSYAKKVVAGKIIAGDSVKKDVQATSERFKKILKERLSVLL